MEDVVRRLFRNHNGRCIGVGADQSGHDRCIGNPQAIDAAYAEPVINNSHFVTAHLARSNRVVLRYTMASDIMPDIGVAGYISTWRQFFSSEPIKGFLSDDIPYDLDACAERVEILSLRDELITRRGRLANEN